MKRCHLEIASPAVPFEQRWRVFGSAYGGAAQISGNATLGSHDATARVYGGLGGAAYALSPATQLGFALGGGTAFGLSDGLGSGRSDLFQAGVFARHNFAHSGYLTGAFAYGSGDGVTTFNLPDKRGRVSAGLDNMGGSSADRLNPSMTSGILGATGGAQSQTLSVSQIPSHRHSNWLSDPGHAHGFYAGIDWNYISASGGGVGISSGPRNSGTTASLTGITLNNAFEGGGQSHLNVQPTIVCNYIIRIK